MYVFFLGLIPQGIRPSQHRTALLSVIASGLEIRRLLADRMRTQAISKPRGEGPSIPFSTGPQSPSLRVYPW